MNFQIFGSEKAPTLLLIPGLGVSYEIFLPLIRLVEERFRIIAVEVDGFTLGKHTRFTSVDDQASQIIAYVQAYFDGHLDCAYGLSLGGKILSRILERNVLTIDHAILDAAPLLPLPNDTIRQSTCGHATIGRDFGKQSSAVTISMCSSTSARRFGRGVEDKPS